MGGALTSVDMAFMLLLPLLTAPIAGAAAGVVTVLADCGCRFTEGEASDGDLSITYSTEPSLTLRVRLVTFCFPRPSCTALHAPVIANGCAQTPTIPCSWRHVLLCPASQLRHDRCLPAGNRCSKFIMLVLNAVVRGKWKGRHACSM